MEQASNNCASSEVFCDGKKLSLGLEVVSARLGVANLAVGLFPWHKDIETQSENSTVGSFADVNDMNQRKLPQRARPFALCGGRRKGITCHPIVETHIGCLISKAHVPRSYSAIYLRR